MPRIQRLETRYNGVRVIAMRYRIATARWCPWLVAMGEHVLPCDTLQRGHLLTRLYKLAA